MKKPEQRPAPNWTAEDRARHRAIREKFQREKPTLDQLVKESGVPPIPQRAYRELRAALQRLRKAREAAGLSLSEIADRTGIDKAALSRLETGGNANPTVVTLMRYASAVGKRLTWQMDDVPLTR